MSAHCFDFDTVINRNNTYCEKWDDMQALFGVSPAEGGIPLWVADMEFLPPPAVKKALSAMIDGVLGYSGNYAEYHAAIAGWMERRHNWHIEPQWIFASHGIVMGVNLAVQAFCRPGDNVVLQTPVYYPFFGAVRNNGCHVTANRLVRKGQGRYEMDFDALEAQIDARTRMLILCSPHNPGGRVWTRPELERLAEVCCRHDLLIVADEIHHDLVYPDAGYRHTVMASIAPEVAARTITCTSATKTFNLAGTLTGNVIISNPTLHRQYERQVHRAGMFLPNTFGMIAAMAAYTHGDAWLDSLLPYLATNRDTVALAVRALPGVDCMPLEGTYLSWLDFSGYCERTGCDMAEVVRRIQQDARLALNHGTTYGPGGESGMRLNFACAKSQLSEALQRFVKALA